MKSKFVLYCVLGGLPMTIAAWSAGKFGWWWLSGIVMAAAFVPVALFGPRGVLRQLGVIAPVMLIVTTFCTWSEAMIFSPTFQEHASRNLAGSAVMYLMIAVVLAVLGWALKLTQTSGPAGEHRAPALAALMVLLCGLAYLLYYAVFGAITFHFFTRGYYPHALQDVARLGQWFWAIEFGRGVLMALAVLPVIYTLRMKRWQAAMAVGVLMWVAGGLAPLLLPNQFLGALQRFDHTIEILTQNASLGITAVLLLRPKPAAIGGAQSLR